MKKLTAMIVIVSLLSSAAVFAAGAKETTGPEVEKVTYFCTVGAYLKTLQDEINKWNEGDGKKAGVFLELDSNINEGTSAAEILMEAGTYHDLSDVPDGAQGQSWVIHGWVKNLDDIDDPELKALIDSYRPYMAPGINYVNGILVALPLEVLPLKFAVNTDLFKKNNLELPKTWADVVHAAQVITENGNGKEFGFGGTTWASLFYSRNICNTCMNSTEVGMWDPNTAKFDFSQFEVPIKAIREMYQHDWILGMDDLGIDEIRAQFSAGNVGMFPAPAYDVSVYTNQFPAQCNWEVIDMPTYEEGPAPYKGVYENRLGCGICAPPYDKSSPKHQAAIVKAFMFLNSDYLNTKIYEAGGMIPAKTELIDKATNVVDIPQWKKMADLHDYTSIYLTPEDVVPLEGDEYHTVFNAIVHGDLDWNDKVIGDLNKRYNDAWEEAKKDPDINTDMYVYPYSHSK